LHEHRKKNSSHSFKLWQRYFTLTKFFLSFFTGWFCEVIGKVMLILVHSNGFFQNALFMNFAWNFYMKSRKNSRKIPTLEFDCSVTKNILFQDQFKLSFRLMSQSSTIFRLNFLKSLLYNNFFLQNQWEWQLIYKID
jgi:hypothetical protein